MKKRKRSKDMKRKNNKLTPEQEKRMGRNELNKGKPYSAYLKEQEKK